MLFSANDTNNIKTDEILEIIENENQCLWKQLRH